MFKRFWIGLAIVTALGLAGVATFAQDCDKIVSDGANILGGRATGAIEEAAKTINSQGGDAKVVTVGQLSGTPEAFFHSRVSDCRSWQSATGGIKNNLVVFFVSTNPKKLGIFYGAEMAGMIGSSANAIKMQFMAPAFKDGDWTRGFVQGETQVGLRIRAFNEAALHPTQTTTTTTEVHNETDYSGVIYWTLGIGFLASLVWFLLYMHGNSKKQRESIIAAQQDASQTSARVADMIERLKAQYAESKALGNKVDDKIGAVNLVSEQFARLGNSESTNPATTGLSADQYTTISRAYQRLMDQLITLQRDSKPSSSVSGHSKWSSTKSKYGSSTSEQVGQSRPYVAPTRLSDPPPTPQPTSTHTTTNTTVFVDNSPAYIPIIVDEPVYREREPDPEPAYSHSSYSSRSSDSDSGSSSSYSSSDSSSSSYDSGSSSDYSSSDSGSSDSGSSSDF